MEGEEIELEEEEEMYETVPLVVEEEEQGQGSEEEERAVITICAQTNLQPQTARTFKFKGYIGNIPVCALIDSGSTHIDSGSTHSFINPDIAQTLQLTTTQTDPMMVTIANGTQMNCTQVCKNLKFSIQK